MNALTNAFDNIFSSVTQTVSTYVINGLTYKEIRKIAEGGYGNIYEVEEQSSGKRYALKKVKFFVCF